MVQAQDPLSDCEIYMDELELQLKKDLKDTKKYYHIQLEEGNNIFKKDLKSITSSREKRELKKQYRDFIKGLEKDYNREMDKLEDTFFDTLTDLEEDCGARAVRRRLIQYEQSYASYMRRR